LILLGNKCDLIETPRQEHCVTRIEGQDLATKHGWLFAEVSALKNIGIEQAAIDLATQVMD
jgi:hypothetical protein